jgi:hypothetical protein
MFKSTLLRLQVAIISMSSYTVIHVDCEETQSSRVVKRIAEIFTGCDGHAHSICSGAAPVVDITQRQFRVPLF